MMFKKISPVFIVVLAILIFGPILSAAIEIPNPLRAKTFQELLYNIVDFLFNLSIPLAALMIIVAGFFFVTAMGKPEQIAIARNIILWTLIGFLVILSARGLISFLMEVVFPPAR